MKTQNIVVYTQHTLCAIIDFITSVSLCQSVLSLSLTGANTDSVSSIGDSNVTTKNDLISAHQVGVQMCMTVFCTELPMACCHCLIINNNWIKLYMVDKIPGAHVCDPLHGHSNPVLILVIAAGVWWAAHHLVSPFLHKKTFILKSNRKNFAWQ